MTVIYQLTFVTKNCAHSTHGNVIVKTSLANIYFIDHNIMISGFRIKLAIEILSLGNRRKFLRSMLVKLKKEIKAGVPNVKKSALTNSIH